MKLKVVALFLLMVSWLQPVWAQGDERQAAVQLARSTLAMRLGITNEIELQLVSVAATNWLDTSLGCPQPGYAYSQVVLPGYRVTFRSGEKRIAVNVGSGRAVLCEQAYGASGFSDSMARELVEAARAELSGLLNIDGRLVDLVSVRSSRLGEVCSTAGPGRTATEDGYRITLSVEGRQFDFFGDVQGVFLCRPIR